MRRFGAACVALLWLSACGGGEDASAPGDDGGAGAETWRTSACGACVAATCTDEESACRADPGCGAWLDCRNACPTGVDGAIDEACTSACPAPTGAWLTARDGAETCRVQAACAACGWSSDGGSPDAGGADADAGENPYLHQTCGPSSGTDVCQTCWEERCCESVEAITNGGPANQLADCFTACQTLACEYDCYQQYSDGIRDFGGWAACVSVECIGAGSCKAHGMCGLCEYQQCGNEFANCETDPECVLIERCSLVCADDTACSKACVTKYPGGKSLYETLAVCVSNKCASACGM